MTNKLQTSREMFTADVYQKRNTRDDTEDLRDEIAERLLFS